MSTCRSCGAPIVWARTAWGKLGPFEPDPDGLFCISEGEAVQAGMFDDGRPRFTSHFATCEQADEWRKS